METVCVAAGLGQALADAATLTGVAAKSGDPNSVETACSAARALIRSVPFPPELATQIAGAFVSTTGKVLSQSPHTASAIAHTRPAKGRLPLP
jgi:hypothetical protein